MEYRTGPVGAITDIYQQQLLELKELLAPIPEGLFEKIINPAASEDFVSIRSIIRHVVESGFSYSNHVRKRFGENYFVPTLHFQTVAEALEQLDQMFRYTLETLNNKMHLTDQDLANTIIKTGWSVCDMEALLEHAVMHIIRHRFQIEKILLKELL